LAEPVTKPGLGDLVMAALRAWGAAGPRRMARFARMAWRIWRQSVRRRRSMRRLGAPVPWVIEVSPTLRCNYNCGGCYSRGRPKADELSADELDGLFAEAEALGVVGIVLTGGEPLMRPELLDLLERHRRLLFVPFTNGALMTPAIARRLARSGNTVTFVSVEGFPADTDGRRAPGAHAAALRALELLREADAISAFNAMVTTRNAGRVASDVFVDEMVARGCSLGAFTEYVPSGPSPRPEWVLGPDARAGLRRRIEALRRSKPIVLIHFPDDEYGLDNRCFAAGEDVLHVNAAGGVEPCPFAPVACDNVREGGLAAAFQSAFLRAVRERPGLRRRERLPCALFEHLDELKALAAEFGASSDPAGG